MLNNTAFALQIFAKEQVHWPGGLAQIVLSQIRMELAMGNSPVEIEAGLNLNQPFR